MNNFGDMECTSPKFEVHTFLDEIMERKLVFQVIKMNDSIFIYINNRENNFFGDMSLAMKSRYETRPIGTKLIGNSPEDFSRDIATRLTKKTGKTVFLSCNLEADKAFIPLVEQRIYEEMKKKPAAF